MKLTGPNRSIGLIPCAWRQVRPTPNLISNSSNSRYTVVSDGPCRRHRQHVRWRTVVACRADKPGSASPASCVQCRATMFFDDLVVMARGEAPDPIPNSAVKTLSADGTAS